MKEFTQVTGIAVPLQRSNVDTDQIIPAVYLKSISRSGFADGLFNNWRTNEPDFVLNRPEYKESSILFAGPEFGTGSSREHAVWALNDFGFRAVFSSRFADIFRQNSGKQGLLTGIIDQADIEKIWKYLEENPGITATVDLEKRTVNVGDTDYTFEVDDYVRWRLLNGFDDIDITLTHEADIDAYEAKRPSFKPKTLPIKTAGKATVESAHYIDKIVE